MFVLSDIKQKWKEDKTMSWLRTAASAYANVTTDPEWPKFEILETNKVLLN